MSAEGWTDDERRAFDLSGELAKLVLGLPEQHPMEREEIAHTFHVLQNYLLGRATYRDYLAETGYDPMPSPNTSDAESWS